MPSLCSLQACSVERRDGTTRLYPGHDPIPQAQPLLDVRIRNTEALHDEGLPQRSHIGKVAPARRVLLLQLDLLLEALAGLQDGEGLVLGGDRVAGPLLCSRDGLGPYGVRCRGRVGEGRVGRRDAHLSQPLREVWARHVVWIAAIGGDCWILCVSQGF